MTMTFRKSSSHDGFTFIELMATVVIIGIVSAMAVPRFDAAFERIRYRSANRLLVSKIKVARSLAISSKVQHGVFFDGTTKLVVVFRDDLNPASYQFDTGDSVITTDSLGREFSWVGTNLDGDVLVFGANGAAHFTASGGTGANIVTMLSSGHTLAITSHNVLASTGRIKSMSNYY
ncbi:MAG: prepilin-type N-terminal cleavage/methylation domain-containing protein [candidate division Zixibacteria bacterium]|nr:prepilin-type N-terminal cleavage/methylation domain-containing protein [candidate division Zixibacteria bacterium]